MIQTGRRELPGAQRASSLSSAPNRDSSFSNNLNNSYSNNSNGGSNHNLNSLSSAAVMVEEERELVPEDFNVTTKLLFLPEGIFCCLCFSVTLYVNLFVSLSETI